MQALGAVRQRVEAAAAGQQRIRFNPVLITLAPAAERRRDKNHILWRGVTAPVLEDAVLDDGIRPGSLPGLDGARCR